MTQEKTCPACGAPLTITGQNDAVRCAFCGIDLVIQDPGGEVAFRIAGQPELQKETLSEPEGGPGNLVGEEPIYPESQAFETPPIAVPSSFEPGRTSPSFQPELSSGRTADYPASSERKGMMGFKRWLVIGGAALLGLVLLCACLVFAFSMIMQNVNY